MKTIGVCRANLAPVSGPPACTAPRASQSSPGSPVALPAVSFFLCLHLWGPEPPPTNRFRLLNSKVPSTDPSSPIAHPCPDPIQLPYFSLLRLSEGTAQGAVRWCTFLAIAGCPESPDPVLFTQPLPPAQSTAQGRPRAGKRDFLYSLFRRCHPPPMPCQGSAFPTSLQVGSPSRC